MSLEDEELEELTREIRRQIESNKAFLQRVSDDDFQDEEEGEDPSSASEEGELEEYEEL